MSDGRNVLHVIGYMGTRSAYLNIPLEEAKRRWCEENDENEPFHTVTFEFGDYSFYEYDAWNGEYE